MLGKSLTALLAGTQGSSFGSDPGKQAVLVEPPRAHGQLAIGYSRPFVPRPVRVQLENDFAGSVQNVGGEFAGLLS
jgi:hypothetical protein